MKPILFNTDMVRAIQDNRKTVTRRVVKGYALEHLELDTDGSIIGVYNQFEGHVFPIMAYAPYRPGDILYVRETWQHGFGGAYLYKADAGHDLFMTPDGELVSDIPWRPSIHMPREAARLFLRVTDVRVEKLQKISVDEMKAEGAERKSIRPSGCFCVWKTETCLNEPCENRDGYEYLCWVKPFSELWNSTIKKSDRALYGWDANPWV